MKTIKLATIALAFSLVATSVNAKSGGWFGFIAIPGGVGLSEEDQRAACYANGQSDGYLDNNTSPDIKGIPKDKKCRESYEAGKTDARAFVEKNCRDFRAVLKQVESGITSFEERYQGSLNHTAETMKEMMRECY